MIKFYMFRFQLVVFLVVSAFAVSVAYSQDAPSAAPEAAEPPAQTLFQEDVPKTAEEKPTTDSSSSKPPSLSDYLNSQTSSLSSDSLGDSSSDAIPPLDNQALQGLNDPLPSGRSNVDSDEELRQEAFKGVSQKMLPLKPSEIRRMLELYDETTQASETPVYPTPDPESAFQGISLDPGSKPLVIKTAIGNVTTVSLVDITGQPWPIQDLTWAGDFQIEQPEAGSHMLRITPTSEFAAGNISMRLLGLNPPVIFTLKAERKSVHVRLDVQIPEVGPKGILPPVSTPVSTKAGDDFMTSVLVGVVKGKDTVQMKVDGIDGRTTAYSKGGMVYVRTPYTMLSPAWVKSVQSGDGTKVYALNNTPVILLSDKGKMVRAYLSRKEQADEQY